MPVILRSSIVLLSEKLQHVEKPGSVANVSMFVQVLEYGLYLAKALKKGMYMNLHSLQYFTQGDLVWFSSKAYNAARAMLTVKDFENCEILCNISKSFNKLVSEDSEEYGSNNLEFWYLKCGILELMTKSLQEGDEIILWNDIRVESIQLLSTVEQLLDREADNNDKSRENLISCYCHLQLFHFKEELAVGIAEEAINILHKCKLRLPIADLAKLYLSFADLTIEKTVNNKVAILSALVEKGLGIHQPCYLNKVFAWSKVIFEAIDSNTDSCKSLFKKIHMVIKVNKTKGQPIPLAEIEWLSTTCWKHGVATIMYVSFEFTTFSCPIPTSSKKRR